MAQDTAPPAITGLRARRPLSEALRSSLGSSVVCTARGSCFQQGSQSGMQEVSFDLISEGWFGVSRVKKLGGRVEGGMGRKMVQEGKSALGKACHGQGCSYTLVGIQSMEGGGGRICGLHEGGRIRGISLLPPWHLTYGPSYIDT